MSPGPRDLSALLAAFPPDRTSPSLPGSGAPSSVAGVVDALGGVTLADGLYRVFDADGVRAWTAAAGEAFPSCAGRVTVFAADWLGRLLAADADRRDPSGRELVLLLEPGTGEVLEVPCTVEQVHTQELLEAPDALVAADLYAQWRRASGDDAPLALSECVGYRIPLLLGGADEVENLERCDMAVYWSLAGQVAQQVAGLPDGTPITSVRGADDPP